ncbi:glycosyl transferase [Kocuria flava]|uniref:Glycosyl transferase n=1 Tax=Kocuria flava TaxID=446860 RepID=A0A0U3IBM5_9MICC|nr:glycosyltransferase [Kocuria flava]ALU40828.1 glycosyl transferase [Kocuria flava]GEO92228.1 glycosyl transferase family 1 [Kocuria flava]
MRLLLLTSGTRGDVEPFAALAHRATAAGHEVRLGVPENPGVDLAGLDAVGLDVDFHRLVAEHGISPWTAVRYFRREVGPGMRRMLAAAVRETLAFRPDAVVHHAKVLTAPAAARALGVPHVLVEAVPVLTPTGEFPAPGVVHRDLGPLNRSTYAVGRGATRMFRRDLLRACASLPGGNTGAVAAALAPPTATLVAASPQLLARPADWPASVHLTGAWHDSSPGAALEPAVEDFARSGPFLLAIFGSMAAGDPLARGRAVVGAARAHGLRTLLLTGWGGLALSEDCAGPDVLVRAGAPLDLLAPHAAAAVHHGGAGTVHAVARAGVPAVVVPFLADQPFWGRQVHARGLGPAPLSRRRLTTTALTAAVGEALGCRRRAQEVGERIRQEDGLAAALAVLEDLPAHP